MEEIRHMDLESEDLVAYRVEQLKELFPEIATEGDGSIDFEKLRLILGDEVDEGDERYAFTWPGKADAIRQAQTVSTATLRPCPEKSVNWDTTQNLYIEGDNLEVLKLLQRGYHGKVKLIYIDPPYNTGHDFVYRDSFGDSIENYREQAGLSGQSNADTSGRYHSNWCSMMYPRLKLARELLSDDGAIFISIDDNEMKNLMELCDEVFGDSNFKSCIAWQKRYTRSNNTVDFTTMVEHVLVYAKSSSFVVNLLPRTADSDEGYTNPDNDPRGPWITSSYVNPARREDRPNLVYKIPAPDGRIVGHPTNAWKYSQEECEKHIAEGRLWWGLDGKALYPRKKNYLSEARGITPVNLWKQEYAGNTDMGGKEAKDLLGGKYFDFPKPTLLMRRVLEHASDCGSIVMDFFSGSASMADAVMQENALDGGNRHFIMIQLPEKTLDGSEAFKAGYSNLCDIGEERIRRAGKKIAEEIEESNRQLKIGEEPKKVPDIGFRVLKLDDSGIAKPEPGQLMLDRVKPERTDEDIVFEMMLKWGIELTYPIEKTEIGGYPCYSVAGDALICCMQKGLTVGAIQAIADRLPSRVLMLDSILDDTLKLNAVQIFKHAEEKHQVTIDLRTV
ncbi:site-specific DNA-methyltransferase [Collinsella sp. AM17-1]|uniref:site-specific DNA-methyltransferase n=1 Tax=Collinsella sp. AM17-1 TaxID=2292027 RepID=UPI000E528ACD|nr:site-specific DNA-methyltransferase [Collinsella sp. AM17-1]RHH73539.1 site-specific DNA-methyltransferase [Collinsella sp. AM17-1]